MYKSVAIGAVLAAGCLMGCVAKLELARNGQPQYAIVQGAQPTPAEIFAAQELSDYLAKVTGARFEVMSETASVLPVRAIYVGWTEFARKHGIEGQTLGEEEWIIKTLDKNIILVGGRPRGTLYAVYEFLENQVGVHWLDEFTEVMPSKPMLKLNQLDVREKPLFVDRNIYTYLYGDPQRVGLFNARNKFTATYNVNNKFGLYPNVGSPGYIHTFFAYSKDWQTNHPEYLAMNPQGQRVQAVDGGGPGQICLTHPEVRKLMLAKLRGYIAADRARAAKAGCPPPRIYCVDENDTPMVCQCPNCKAFLERETYSGLLIELVNFMADGIKDEYPDVLVETFLYPANCELPKTIRPRDNVMIRIAQLNAEYATGVRDPGFFPDMFRPLTHVVNRQAADAVRSWGSIVKHLGYWDYWRIYSLDKFATPYANLACIKSDLELLLDNKVEMMFVEMEQVFPTMYNHMSFCALKYWLGLKMLQNPHQDMEPLVQAFMAGYYGPAAGEMREYLDYMERRVAAVPENIKISALKPRERPYLDPEFFLTSERLLDEAEAQCGTNKPALLHVRCERIPVDAALYCLWEKLQSALPVGKTLPFDREAVLRRYEICCLARMETFYRPDRLEMGKKALAEQLEKFREMPVIEKRKAEKIPELRVPVLKENADGDLSKVDWTNAAVIAWKACLTGEARPERKLSGRLAHDDLFLYIQLAEETDTAKLNPIWWSGDNWELFFAVERGKTPYRQFAVTPIGGQASNEWQSSLPPVLTKWDSATVVKADKAGGVWKVSLAFPLARLLPGGVKPGQKFYANFYRTTPAPGMHMAWSPSFDKNFHLLDRLGELTLE